MMPVSIVRTFAFFSLVCPLILIHHSQAESPANAISSLNAPTNSGDFGASILVRSSRVQTDLSDLQSDVQQCLSIFADRKEDAGIRRPWDLMHAALAFGKDAHFIVSGEEQNGLGWLCQNGAGQGMRLLQAGAGEVIPLFGPGYEGHPGQLLSILAQCSVPIDQVIQIGEQEFTVEDLIAYEKRTCRPNTELTFKLIGFSHYLEPDDSWENRFGTWTIERVLEEELNQPIQGASCGGTHRLNGISHAVLSRYEKQFPLDTHVWQRAEAKLKEYTRLAMTSQMSDGRFGSDQFNYVRVYEHDLNRRLWVTGHTLEWLVYFLPEQDLTDRRVLKAVSHVTNLLLDNQDFDWEIGKKYHALHALAIFNRRVFQSNTRPEINQLAELELEENKRRQ